MDRVQPGIFIMLLQQVGEGGGLVVQGGKGRKGVQPAWRHLQDVLWRDLGLGCSRRRGAGGAGGRGLRMNGDAAQSGTSVTFLV